MEPSAIVAFQQYVLSETRTGALLHLDFKVTEPGIIGVVGPQGSGKSLLLSALSGHVPRGIQTSGTMNVRGQAPKGPVTEPALRGEPAPQRGTVHRVLTQPFGAAAGGRKGPDNVEPALRGAGLWESFQARLSMPFQDLHVYERLALLATRALVGQWPYLLLDDPTRELDPMAADVFRRIVTHIAEHIPVFWVSRAFRRVAPTAQRLIVLSEGQVIGDGSADAIAIAPPPGVQKILEDAVGSSADTGLDGLYRSLLALGSQGERAIHAAVQSLTGQYLPQARDVLKDADTTDRKSEAIKIRSLGLIARTAPVGQNLRTLYSIMTVAGDLKRIMDHAVNIAEITLAIGEEPLIKPLIDIPRMAEKAQSMVRRSLDALVRRDVNLARQVNDDDEHIDDLYRELFEELVGFVTDGGDSYRAGQALYLLFVARYLEKVADHAKAIANQVIFMVEGQHPAKTSKGLHDFPQTFLPR